MRTLLPRFGSTLISVAFSESLAANFRSSFLRDHNLSYHIKLILYLTSYILKWKFTFRYIRDVGNITSETAY